LSLAQEEFLLSLECFLLAAVFYLLAVVAGSIEGRRDTPKQFLLYFHTMQQAVFSFGCTRHETKSQKKERLRKERERHFKEERRRKRNENPSVPIPKRPSWCILPPHRLEGFDFWIHTLKGETFLQKRTFLLDTIEKMKIPPPSLPGFDSKSGDAMRKEYLFKAQKVMSYLHENQALRWKFKGFFTNWRTRRCSPVNDTDPITLEPIIQPVNIYEFSQRKLYRFESKSIAKHIHQQLTRNDGQIPTPVHPRNPLTNQPFRIEQLMGLLKQCKTFGYSSWVLEAFISARYDMTSFVAIHSKPLRLHALKTSMGDEGSWDFIDTMTDFIKSQHALHGKLYTKGAYEWAITHALREKRMESWKKLCLKWYETDIIIDDAVAKDMFLGVIEAKTKLLCEPPLELLELKTRRKSMRGEGNGGRSS
jgi:hypothetical protein